MKDLRLTVLDAGTLIPADKKFDPELPMFQDLRQFGEVDIWECTEPHQIIDRAAGRDIVIGNKIPFTKEVLRQLTDMSVGGVHSLKYGTVLATGYDCVDIQAAALYGVPWSNVPVYGTSAVKEYVFAALLGGMRDIPRHCDLARTRKWAQHGKFSMPVGRLDQLDGKTMGVIGAAGRIGSSVINTARSFDMPVNGFDLRPREMDGVNWMESSEDVLRNSDIVTIHANWDKEKSQPVITMDTVQMMREGSILINAARGQFVELDAVKYALENGIFPWSVHDVLPPEMEPPKNPAQCEQIEELIALGAIITPHIAWFTRKSVLNLWSQTIQNIIAWISGAPVNTINMPFAA